MANGKRACDCTCVDMKTSSQFLLTAIAFCVPAAFGQVWSQIMDLSTGPFDQSGSVAREYKNCCSGGLWIASPWGNYANAYASTVTNPELRVPRDPGGSAAASIGGQQCTSSAVGVCFNDPSTNTWETGYYRDPQQTLQSANLYSPLKGLSLFGSFQPGSTSFVNPDSTAIATIFFHQQYYYLGGDEYGFAFDAKKNELSLYISRNTNITGAQAAMIPIPRDTWDMAVLHYFNVWFECNGGCVMMYSVQDASYNFDVPVQTLSSTQVLAASYPYGSPLSVPQVDTLMQNFYYATGYVSAAAQHTNADSRNAISSDFGLNIQAVKVAK